MSEPAPKEQAGKKRRVQSAEEKESWRQANKIGEILGEVGPQQVGHIRRIVKKKGIDWVKERLRETWKIHKDGGLEVLDGTRNRTPGGIFFFVCKQHWLDDVDSIEADIDALDVEKQTA